MSVQVFGWLKPTLELSLVEGGSLLPNTKYYVCGVMKFTPMVYHSVGPPVSDVYEITTTTTAKSIQIYAKTYRQITTFSSGGAGITNVECARHCLMTNDLIKISSGSYAGTWTVTRIDYNNFSIATSYIDNVSVQCYTDSVNYGRPTDLRYQAGCRASACHFISYYVYTSHPIPDGLTFMSYQAWTSTPYQTYNNTNPTTVTAQPAQDMTYTCGCLKVKNISNGMMKPIADNYGTILVSVNGNHTLQDIYNEVQASGFIYNCTYNTVNKVFMLAGTILQINNTGTISFVEYNITLIAGELCNVDSAYYKNITFEECLINELTVNQQATLMGHGDRNVIYSNTSQIAVQGLVTGNDNIIYAMPNPAVSMGYCDIPYQSYINLWDNSVYYPIGIIQNKTFVNVGDSGLIQLNYAAMRFINCKIFCTIYWGNNSTKGNEPNVYMFENCYIKKSISLDYHFRIYGFIASWQHWHIYRLLNVNTDEYDNRKKIAIQGAHYINCKFLFYRRTVFYINSFEGDNIEGVQVSITDNDKNSYNGLSDKLGVITIDCLEQKTEMNGHYSLGLVYYPQFDKFYNNFKITISKSGYQTVRLFVAQLYQQGFYNAEFRVCLIPTTVNINQPELTTLNIEDCSTPALTDGSIEITASGNQILAYNLEKI